ncbi:clan AA aspartic protease [Sphingomonas naphthae]|uniref:Clan AA aspartic protease n=1 Tax=Sphingomonas naphthae TaxID=1813468 RepID=A0ABY7THL9_9SPHN|nr:clan AA aspartic protease [Sphingomonas naphthae]WCT72296.1 clan AA aspartic protease [Sphingomonas naphthae]
MGTFSASIELSNARHDGLAPMTIDALVDSGALHLCIPAQVAQQLQLDVLDQRQVTVADGRSQLVDYVGPISLRFANRRCLTGALVLGDQALLGAIPMEDMDLVISPARRELTVNPQHPNIAASMAMGFQASGQ